MFNQFLNSLSATSDHRFAAGHRLEVYASQALVPAGQREYGATSHGFCYLGPALPSDKLNLLPDGQTANQVLKSAAIRPFSDDAASKPGNGIPEISECSYKQFTCFVPQQCSVD